MRRWHERVNIRGERIALPDRRAAAGRGLDEGTHRARPASAAQRLLRPAARPDLPAPQRLPELRQLPHRQLVSRRSTSSSETQTRRLLDRARANDHVRLIEVLERDEASLTRILDGLDAIDADHHCDGDDLDLLALADKDAGTTA